MGEWADIGKRINWPLSTVTGDGKGIVLDARRQGKKERKAFRGKLPSCMVLWISRMEIANNS